MLNNIFRYIGYVTVSMGLGYVSFLGGKENDYLLKISWNLIPALISLLVFYVTIFGLILKELVIYKGTTGKDISKVLKSIKIQILIEIGIIFVALFSFIVRASCATLTSDLLMVFIATISNSITVFAIIYFLLVIYDSIAGLWELLSTNN